MSRELIKYHLYIGIAAALLFIPFLGQVHLFDWDEINFAESAREMIETGDYLTVRINYTPFSEKPPLFIWMQVVSMKIFGVNEFAARFPNAICGIVTLLVLFNIGRKLYDNRFGLIWVIAYSCSILPFFYFKSGIIDPWFNLFIFSGVYFYIRAFNESTLKKESIWIVASAISIGLGILTKGPVALLIFGIVAVVLLVIKKFNLPINWKNILLYAVVVAFVGGFWFLLQIMDGRFDMVQEFIVYQIRLFNTKDAGHGGFPLYHFVVLLFGVFPASIFAIQGHRYIGPSGSKKNLHLGMVILLWVVLILFSIVKTKIVHYSSLGYFPLTFLASYSIYTILNGRKSFRKYQVVLIAIIGGLVGLVFFLLPLLVLNKDLIIDAGWIKDDFTLGNLQAETGFTYFHLVVGLVLIIGVIVSLVGFKNDIQSKLLALAISSLIFVLGAVVVITPNIEKISQNALIEFIESKKNEDAHVITFFKSYAPPFYKKIGPDEYEQPFDKDAVMYRETPPEKDIYLIARAYQKGTIATNLPYFEYLGEKNGFVFYLRPSK